MGVRPLTEISTITPVKATKKELSKREFGASVQISLKNIFDGCHKDDAKTTLSLRAILYEVSRLTPLTRLIEHHKHL